MSDFIGEAIVLDSDDARFSVANSEFLIKKYAAYYNNLVRALRTPLATIRKSPLSKAEFLLEHGSSWAMMDGSDITGTDLATLTGVTTTPDMTVEYSYLTQTDDDANLFDTSEDNVENHSHKLMQALTQANGAQYRGIAAIGRYMSNRPRAGGDDPVFYGNNGDAPTIGTTQENGDTETLPESAKVNFFIKVNRD